MPTNYREAQLTAIMEAENLVVDMRSGERQWTVSYPERPDDTDRIFERGLKAGREMHKLYLQQLEELAELRKWAPKSKRKSKITDARSGRAQMVDVAIAKIQSGQNRGR